MITGRNVMYTCIHVKSKPFQLNLRPRACARPLSPRRAPPPPPSTHWRVLAGKGSGGQCGGVGSGGVPVCRRLTTARPHPRWRGVGRRKQEEGAAHRMTARVKRMKARRKAARAKTLGVATVQKTRRPPQVKRRQHQPRVRRRSRTQRKGSATGAGNASSEGAAAKEEQAAELG